MYHNNDQEPQHHYGNPQPASSSSGYSDLSSLYATSQQHSSFLGETTRESQQRVPAVMSSSIMVAGTAESEEDSSSSSSSTSSSSSSSSSSSGHMSVGLAKSLPCGTCLQSRCVCSAGGGENNGFDPALLQLQLPQLALLMQQQQQQQQQQLQPVLNPPLLSQQHPLPSPSSSSSTSLSPPVSPKVETEFLSLSPSPFVCQLCQEWFDVYEKMVVHLVVNHSMVYCKFCSRLFRSQSEHTICSSHRGTSPCDLCHEVFRTNSSSTGHELAEHQRKVHDMHACPFCSMSERPQEAYLSHMRRKHHCRDRMLLARTMHAEGIVREVEDTWSFLCRLCKKERRKTELFGHLFTYHGLTLPCLIELLHCGRFFIPVSGYPSPSGTPVTPSSSSSSAVTSGVTGNHSGIVNYHPQPPSSTVNNFINISMNHNVSTCTVCAKPYSVQVPKIAHDVFCAGMAYCQYCTLSFSSGLARELHVVREHSSLQCISCGEPFPAETSLTAHYARSHGAVLCSCCDLLVPVTTSGGGLEEHLATRHGCNNLMPSNIPTLCQVGSTLACNLCMSANKFTSASDDLPSILTHLCQNHCMTPNKALNLLCRPSTSGGLSVGPPEEKKTVKNVPENLNSDSKSGTGVIGFEVPNINAVRGWDVATQGNNNHDVKDEDEEEDDDDDDASENILVPQVNLNVSSENESSVEIPSSDEMLQDAGEISEFEEEEEEDESVLSQTGEEAGVERVSPRKPFNTYGEPDVDPEDVDCVSDSSEDEGVAVVTVVQKIACEVCAEKNFNSPRDLCAHLFSIHKFHWDRKSLVDSDSQYHCELCAHKANDRLALWRHRSQTHRGVEGGGGGKCRFCSLRFRQAEARNRHQLQLHADQQRAFYRCHTCQLLTSSTVVLSRHVALAHPEDLAARAGTNCGVRLKCRVCLLLFPSLAGLRAHFRAVHPAAMVYRCRHCSAHLKTKKTLRHHIKVVHSEARRRDCPACGKVLWSKRAYAIHFRMKHSKASKVGFRCRICQRRFDSKEERKLHYTLDHEGESPYHCVDCGKGFASKSGMYGHRQLHTGSGVSKCEYCGKEFTRKDSYNEHLLIHNGPRHKCPHCPKEFVQRSNLVRHIRIHTGEKPYQCTFCEKRFSDKGACNSHIRVHTREETCSCPYCGQTFSKKQKLKYHIRKHTGEGLIECEICNKMFTNSFALKEHRVIHNRQTQVVCPQCGKGFNSEKYLQRHVAIVHEPSNAFSCPLCPKTFSQQARLKAHVMTHSGVKHMKCLLCDKAYSVRKSLRRHLLEKHQVTPENPQYKRSFHAMSPEEAGLGVAVAAKARRSSPRGTGTTSSSSPGSSSRSAADAPSNTTSGRKRRRVEQIVQSLQHSLRDSTGGNTAAHHHPPENSSVLPSSSSSPSYCQQQERRSPSPTLARINPLVINLPKSGGRKRAVVVRARSRAQARPKRRLRSSEPTDEEEEEEEEGEEEENEGLNLTVAKLEDCVSEERGSSDS